MSDETFTLEICRAEGDTRWPQVDQCDGCGRIVPKGEPMITGITSCCGGGCVRKLCHQCVQRAADLLQKATTP